MYVFYSQDKWQISGRLRGSLIGWVKMANSLQALETLLSLGSGFGLLVVDFSLPLFFSPVRSIRDCRGQYTHNSLGIHTSSKRVWK
ncbi:hypothetical protein I7I48_04037 [Histoplasma ohiense]|nr:hypothetical protein I7I48_04037 [Histoplasma ohiense (nom. inval.)]